MTYASDLNIKDIKDFSFQKVCRIENYNVCKNTHPRWKIEWLYTEINQDLLYSDHRSWVYFITCNGNIMKIGETGNPLGIRKKAKDDNQPLCATTNRLGRYNRYIPSGDSDQFVREYMYDYIQNNSLVEIWAYKCPIVEIECEFNGEKIKVNSTIHKHLEKKLIDYYINYTGRYPVLNTGRY